MKLILSVLAAFLLAGAAHARGVGFQARTMPNGLDAPVKIGVWYPTDAAASPQLLGLQAQVVAPDAPVAGERLGLVVISHGSGGSLSDHFDTALALAKAGFVVAALTHPGDNHEDTSRAAHIADRPAQLKRLIDYMLAEWPDHGRIDPHKVGAFGFSAGGFTVLAAIGGQPALAEVRPHCAAHPVGFDCEMIRRAGVSVSTASPQRSFFTADPRIRAAVIAAPALGYAFGREGLAQVKVPIQLWRAEQDSILPNPWYAEAVIDAMPIPAEYFVVPGADHVDFFAPLFGRAGEGRGRHLQRARRLRPRQVPPDLRRAGRALLPGKAGLARKNARCCRDLARPGVLLWVDDPLRGGLRHGCED